MAARGDGARGACCDVDVLPWVASRIAVAEATPEPSRRAPAVPGREGPAGDLALHGRVGRA